jgi:four helix bundle protein
MPAKSYEDLDVWRKARNFVLDVYRLSRPFPKEELYGLTAQLRRSAASVACNIVEGFRRGTKPDKVRFYQTALASLDESHYQLRLAHDLGYGQTVALRNKAVEIGRMLNAYTQAIMADKPTRTSRTTLYCVAFLTGVMPLSSFSLLASRF